jgi:hypothetical protein
VKFANRRKLLLFGVLSVAYGCFAAVVIVMTAIRTCSMQSDVAADCDPTTINLAVVALVGAYVALAVLFFKRRISGVD